MAEIAPVRSLPMWEESSSVVGWGPRGLACGESPLPFSTRKLAASFATATAVGYQPTGTKPLTSAFPGFAMSATATVLLSAHAISSVLPSGETARAFGVEPGGAFG